MIPGSNLTPAPTTPPTSGLAFDPIETKGPSGLEKQLKSLSLTILGSTGTIEGPGDVRIRLEAPNASPEDVPVAELLQQLDSLQSAPAAPLVMNLAVGNLADGVKALAQGIKGDPPMEASQAADLAASFEGQAKVVERSIRDLIENSTYPAFNEFLKDLVKVAQDIRESASKAKMAAIQASYESMYAAADQMLTAANEAKASRDQQIQAERTQAIGQIITGVVEMAVTIGFGLAGASQLGGTITQISNAVVTGETGLIASDFKASSSELQLKSDLANVAKQRLEAATKLLEQQTQIADDLRDIAKGLRDMVLKIYQDFINAQNQVIQHANV